MNDISDLTSASVIFEVMHDEAVENALGGEPLWMNDYKDKSPGELAEERNALEANRDQSWKGWVAYQLNFDDRKGRVEYLNERLATADV